MTELGRIGKCVESGPPTLLRQPARFRGEAVVHELLHMKVPNHGKLWRVVSSTSTLVRSSVTRFKCSVCGQPATHYT